MDTITKQTQTPLATRTYERYIEGLTTKHLMETNLPSRPKGSSVSDDGILFQAHTTPYKTLITSGCHRFESPIRPTHKAYGIAPTTLRHEPMFKFAAQAIRHGRRVQNCPGATQKKRETSRRNTKDSDKNETRLDQDSNEQKKQWMHGHAMRFDALILGPWYHPRKPMNDVCLALSLFSLGIRERS